MELRGKKILITGAAGFIGSHLSDRLAEANDVVLVDDLSVGDRANLSAAEKRSNVRFVEQDVQDEGAMRALCEGVDVVYHLAISCLRTSLGKPWLSHDVNAGGTLAVCLAARDAGVARFVYVSSSEVYGTAETVPMSEEHPLAPTTVYGASKLAGEHYALACWRTYELPVCIVRPFNTYGPREPWKGSRAEVIPRFLLQLLAGRSPVVYGDGSQTRDFTFVDDTVTGLVAAGACDALVGEIVNVARGEEVSILRIGELLRELTGAQAGVKHEGGRPGDVHRHYADVSKAARLFGYHARTGIEDGLERTLAWFRENRILERADVEAAGLPNW